MTLIFSTTTISKSEVAKNRDVPDSGKSGNFGMSIRIRNPVKSNRILPDLFRLKFVEFSVKK